MTGTPSWLLTVVRVRKVPRCGLERGAGVPAARRQPPEMRPGGRLVGKVEGLRIIFARELEHLLAGHLIAAELGLGANLQILEITHFQLPTFVILAKARISFPFATRSREIPAFAGMTAV
jgi:hypothetical protein